MFSNDISMLDADCISFCDNSMYVLPPKTELNSSLFTENFDLSKPYERNSSRRDATQRKISNNVYIPTYKGFSIANGYSIHNTKNNSSNQKLNLNSGPEKYPISRKVHLSSKKPDSNNAFNFMKNSLNTKHKIKIKSNDSKIDLKIRQHDQKNIRRVETFLGDYNPIKQNRSLSNTGISKNNESLLKAHSKDDKKIKEYMEIKKRDLKKRENENKLIEKQRKEKIEERLKLLSEKVKIREKIQKSHYKTGDIISIDVEDKSESCSSSHSKVYEHSVENSKSESSCSSVKKKLAKWTPMSNEELEIHRLASKNYMSKAINNNQKADNILTDIINISDKIALAKQELMTSVSGKYSNYRTTYQRKKDVSVEIDSSSSSSDEFEDEELNSISSRDYPANNYIKNGFNEVTPIILANRARRKLNMDIQENQERCLDDDSYCAGSAYDDFVIRLIEENQRRYEKSVEVHQTVLLPHKTFPIPIYNIKKNKVTRHHEIIKTTKTDSLTFMRTYLKSKHKTNSDIPKSSTVNTNNSRISEETVYMNNLYSSNDHTSIDRDNNDIGNDFINRKSSSTRNSLIHSNENTDSQIKKPSLVENVNEDIYDSNSFSEVEVTIENSSFTDHVISKHSTRKISEAFTNYRNLENRLSPNSLERKLFTELHYYDGLQASMEQLLQSDRFQGVGFAQQETVSLAQILKARQWKDFQDNETKQCLQQFTSAIANFNDHVHGQQKKSNVKSSSSSPYSSETMSSSSLLHKNVISSTESEASEIVEEIVEFSNSIDSEHRPNDIKNNQFYHPISKTDVKNVKLNSEDARAIPKKYINKEPLKSSYKTIQSKIEQSNIDSIQEISTALSISESFSKNSANLSQDISIVESIDIHSTSEKSAANSNIKNLAIADGYNNDLSSTESIKTVSNLNQSKDLEMSRNHNEEISKAKSIKTDSSLTNNYSNNFEKSTARSIQTESYSYINKGPEMPQNYNDEISTTKSVKTDSNIFQSDKSPKEISTTGSFESETKSKIISSVNNKNSNSKSTSKSIISSTESSVVKSDLNSTYYSKDEFESNSDYQKSTSESEIFSRVNFLDNEKCRKEKLVDKLKRKLNIVKQRRKEKKLRNHISYLDSQIKDLEEELKNPNLSSSSILLPPSPSSKPQNHTNSKDLKILPTINRKSSNSSSASSIISKDEEAKSVTLSLSSSTLTSEVVKDTSFSNKIDIKKADEAETPRSSRQIQFEDINEEYSASNRDSSDLKTPSEKSKDVTDNATNKSKSDNFHILVIDNEKECDFESLGNENDDVKVISARTIHSEISEIPMEGDLSDQEIDIDILDKVEEYEKNKSSIHDNYSEDFSEVYSQRNSITHPEINEISNHEENFSYKTSDDSTASSVSVKSIKSSISSKSSESIPPVIPLRRKFLIQSVPEDSHSLAENTVNKIDKICDDLFNKIFAEIISENKLSNENIPELIDSLLHSKQDDFCELNTSENKESLESSLIEHIDDPQYRILENLISWKDESVLPLVDLAVEQMFFARQNRYGKTSDAFKSCSEHIPNQFLEINSSNEKIRIYNQWKVNQSLERSKIVIDKIFISRIAIFHAVLEIMEKIYELDDEPEPMSWMKDAFNILKNRKVILWQGSEAPNSLESVKEIVKKQLVQSNILNSTQKTVVNRSRQHKWFYKQTDDAVDKLLIDETLQDDLNWQNYDVAIETTIFAITDEINDIVFNDVVEELHQ